MASLSRVSDTCEFGQLLLRGHTAMDRISVKLGLRHNVAKTAITALPLWEDAMKAFQLSAIALLAVAAATPSLAADMPVKARPMPAMVPLYDWSGWYIGGNVGYSWGRSRTDVSYFTAAGTPIAPPPGSVTSSDTKLDGWLGGGQIGANWQSGQWLFGVEADIQWSGQKGSADFLCARTAVIGATVVPSACLPGVTALIPAGVPGASLALNQDLEWFGTARLRVGWLPAPTWLLYVTGGLAFGEIETNATLVGINANLAAVTATTTSSETKWGWTVGGGIEGVISGPWTGKIEYLYMDLGTVNGAVALPPPGIQATYSSRITDNILRVGLNYRFLPTAPMSRM